MKAIVLTKDFKLEQQTKDVPKPGARQVRIAVAAAALNRRDYWMTQKLYPNVRVPVTLGSDGCGKIVEVGEGVDEAWLGETVVINPTTGWPAAENGAASACAAATQDNMPAMHNLKILGMPQDGTFAEFVIVDVSRVHRKPEHLSVAEAASLPLAGVTAFRALFKLGLAKKSSSVFVSGIGSGVSTFAAQFAAAIGCKVVVSSSSKEKLEHAISRHALAGGVLYTDPAKVWVPLAKELIGNQEFDIVIDGAAGRDFNELLKLLKPGGSLVSYGGTAGKPIDLDIFRVFLLQLKILGTSMGSDSDFREMIQFVHDYRITPVVGEIHPWENAIKAINDMEKSNSRGKVVIMTPTCKL